MAADSTSPPPQAAAKLAGDSAAGLAIQGAVAEATTHLQDNDDDDQDVGARPLFQLVGSHALSSSSHPPSASLNASEHQRRDDLLVQ